MYRQGDVLIVPVGLAPKGKLVTDSKDERIVLAHGEATGHAHAIYDEGAVLTETDNERFLEVLKDGGVDLKHEEHATIHLKPGSYKVIRQREYSLEDIRYVQD